MAAVYRALRSQAMERSYEIREARATAEQRSAQRFSAIARWLPRLELQFSQSRRQDFTLLTSGSLGSLEAAFGPLAQPSPISLSRWDVNLTLPIYQRSVQLGLSQAGDEKTLADLQLAERESELDWRLRSLTGNYLLESYRGAILKTSLEIARTNLREAELRFNLGQRTKIDVLRAQANAASLESDQTVQDQSRAVAGRELLEYSGLSDRDLAATGIDGILRDEASIGRAIEEFTEVAELLPRLEPFLKGGFDPAWADRPEEEKAGSSVTGLRPVAPSIEAQLARHSLPYQALVAQEDAAESRAAAAMSGEYPQLALQGNLNKQADNWGDVFTPGQQSYSVSLALTIPIFTGGSIVSSYLDQKHGKEAARTRAAHDLATLKKELERELSGVRALRQTMEARRLQLEQNAEILRLSQISYRVGKTTMVELLTSQNDLLSAKVNLAKARIDLAVLARQLAWNLGIEGLESSENSP